MEGQLGLFPSYFQTKLTLGASGFEPHSPFLGCWCHSLAYLGHQDLDFASMARCPPLKRCERRFLGILSILSQVVKVSGAGTRTSARSRIIGSGPSQPCGVCARVCVAKREVQLPAVNWPRTPPGLCLGTLRSASAPGTPLLNCLQIHSLNQPRQRGEHPPKQRKDLFILLGSVFKGSGSAPLNQSQAHRQTP